MAVEIESWKYNGMGPGMEVKYRATAGGIDWREVTDADGKTVSQVQPPDTDPYAQDPWAPYEGAVQPESKMVVEFTVVKPAENVVFRGVDQRAINEQERRWAREMGY